MLVGSAGVWFCLMLRLDVISVLGDSGGWRERWGKSGGERRNVPTCK